MRYWLVLGAAWPCLCLAEEPPRLDPMVVTGSRAERSAFELPFAVSSVTAAEFAAAGAQINLSEALARVPGLLVNNRHNYAQDLQINSRGFGARASFGVRGLRLYADGIPATAPDGQGQVSHFDLASAERVEILRGPFSALYGNSSGGVIALISRRPEDDRAWIDGSASRFGQRQLRGGGQARFGENGYALLNYADLSVAGFRPHSRADRRLAFARAGLEGPHNRLMFTASNLDQPALDPLGLTRAEFEANPRGTTARATEFNTRKDTAQTQTGLSWQGQRGARRLEAAAYFGRRAVTQWLSIPVAVQQASATHSGGVIDFDRNYGGADLRLHWAAGPLDVVTGLAYEQQDENRRGYENFRGAELGVTGALRRDERNRVSSFDQYAQGEWAFAADWRGTLGLRHGEIRFRSDDRFITAGNPDDSGQRSFSYVSPVAGLSYRAAPGLNLYASAGRGFESPTLNELAYSPGIGAQTSRQFELGGKLRAARSRVELALFQADTEDELVVAANNGGRATFANAGRTRRRGAELSLFAALPARLEARLAATWLDAVYRDAFVASATAVPAGNRLPATARASTYGELAWAARPALTVAIEARAVSRVAVSDANSDFAAGYGLLALRAEHVLDWNDLRLRTLARLDNALDRIYAGSVIVNEGNGRFFEPGAPRAVFLGWTLEGRL